MRIQKQSLTALVAVAVSFSFVMSVARCAAGSDPAALDTPAENLTKLKMDRLDPAIDRIVPADSII